MRRQSNVFAATVLAAAIAAAATVSAQPSPQAQATPAAPQLAPELSTKPYSRLFEQRLPDVSSTTRRIEVRPNSAWRFLCGMPMLPVDSALDPKFETPPHDTTTRFSMRVVDPGDCH
jgi:hypothetical protein